MKYAIICGAVALALFVAAAADAAGPGQRFSGGFYGGNYYGHVGGHHHGYGGHGCCPPGYDVSPRGGRYGHYYNGSHGAFGVPQMASPAYVAGPPTAAVTYPYYTVRGPRDFLLDNPPSLGP